MGAQIRLTRPADDQPRTWLVLASAIVGGALGVALVLAASHTSDGATLAGSAREPASRERAAAPATAHAVAAPATRPVAAIPATAALDAPAATAPTATGTPSPSAAREAIAAGSPEAAAAPGGDGDGAGAPPTPASANKSAHGPMVHEDDSQRPRSRVSQIVPGRVAYVRCDGLATRNGPYPCPRDRVLEAAVWDVLDRVRECRGARPVVDERGFELRLDFRSGAPAEAELRAPAAGQRSLEAVLSRCLGEPLGRLETKLPASRMVVSFRFRLL